jgi:hypothetical protein
MHLILGNEPRSKEQGAKMHLISGYQQKSKEQGAVIHLISLNHPISKPVHNLKVVSTQCE